MTFVTRDFLVLFLQYIGVQRDALSSSLPCSYSDGALRNNIPLFNISHLHSLLHLSPIAQTYQEIGYELRCELSETDPIFALLLLVILAPLVAHAFFIATKEHVLHVQTFYITETQRRTGGSL
jgi:hypothetical protein